MSGSEPYDGPAWLLMEDETAGEPAASEEDQRRLALEHILDAWDDALGEGVDPDILGATAIFAAFSDMIDTYGEEAAVRLAEGLVQRIREGEFTLNRTTQ